MGSIRLHKEHGVNPSLVVCFWCGEGTGVALLGHNKGKEAPPKIVGSLEFCDACMSRVGDGIIFIEAVTEEPAGGMPEIQEGLYPTGSFTAVKRDAVSNFLTGDYLTSVLEKGKCLLDTEAYQQLFGHIG